MNILNVSADKEDNSPGKIIQPKDKESNPTINSILKFELYLAESDIFMPQLECEVYDYIFIGMLNPTFGLFLINIKNLIDDTNKQIDEDLKALKAKLRYYMTTDIVTNAVGNLAGLDKLLQNKKLGEIDTSGNQNRISLDESKENIQQSPVKLEKLKQ